MLQSNVPQPHFARADLLLRQCCSVSDFCWPSHLSCWRVSLSHQLRFGDVVPPGAFQSKARSSRGGNMLFLFKIPGAALSRVGLECQQMDNPSCHGTRSTSCSDPGLGTAMKAFHNIASNWTLVGTAGKLMSTENTLILGFSRAGLSQSPHPRSTDDRIW